MSSSVRDVLCRELEKATQEYSRARTAAEKVRRSGPNSEIPEPGRSALGRAQARWDVASRALAEFDNRHPHNHS
jgi:hypothetical protein